MPPSKVTAELVDEQEFTQQRGKQCSEKGVPRSRADMAQGRSLKPGGGRSVARKEEEGIQGASPMEPGWQGPNLGY